MGIMLDTIGKLIARYLQHEAIGFEPFTPSDPERLRTIIQPGDVLLVEGNNRISGVIKYLTQSTWSHAALYVGRDRRRGRAERRAACHDRGQSRQGVVTAPLSKYTSYHTRVCRPVGLSYEDREHVVQLHASSGVGFDYDTKNIVDLMRFFIPVPIPQQWRRQHASPSAPAIRPGHLLRSLIAQAFESVRYPILPRMTKSARRKERRRAHPAHPPSFALHAARFRHLALLRGGEADDRGRIRLHRTALGRQAETARGGSGHL